MRKELEILTAKYTIFPCSSHRNRYNIFIESGQAAGWLRTLTHDNDRWCGAKKQAEKKIKELA